MKIIKDLLFEMKNPNYELAKAAEEQIVIEFEDLLEQANKLEKALTSTWVDDDSRFYPEDYIELIKVWQEFKKSQGIE